MANKKKQRRTLFFLVIVMMVILGAYIGLSKLNDKKESKEAQEAQAEEDISLSHIDGSKAVKIDFKNQHGNMTLVKENDIWINEADKKFPVNQTYASDMLETMADISATRIILKDAKDLTEYGLEEPSLIVTLTLEDNTKISVMLGDEIPIEGGYYALADNNSIVYAFDSTFYTSFQYTESQMIEMEETPSITTDYMTHLTVERKDGDSFELVYDKDGDESTEYSLWGIMQPYDTQVKADPSKVSELLENFSSYSFLECVDYSHADAATYGLDNLTAKIDLEYYEVDEKETQVDKVFQLKIGGTDEQGNYYVQPSKSNAVYIMPVEDVDAMIGINAFDYVYTAVVEDSLEDMESIDLEANGEKYHMEITEIVKDKEKRYSFTINDEKVDETDFRLDYETITNLTLEGEIVEKVSDNTPVYTITLKGKNKTTKLEFLPYDGKNYYRLKINGIAYFLVSMRRADQIRDSYR
jgi:hypothetical protein